MYGSNFCMSFILNLFSLNFYLLMCYMCYLSFDVLYVLFIFWCVIRVIYLSIILTIWNNNLIVWIVLKFARLSHYLFFVLRLFLRLLHFVQMDNFKIRILIWLLPIHHILYCLVCNYKEKENWALMLKTSNKIKNFIFILDSKPKEEKWTG